MNYLKLSILVSVIFHALILSYKPAKIQKKKQPKKTKIKLNSKTKTPKISAYLGTNTCPKYYIGIGIMQNLFGEVTYVAKGGPAYRNGIDVGDTILTNIDNSKLKEGQVLNISVSRKGITTMYHIKVERICSEDN